MTLLLLALLLFVLFGGSRIAAAGKGLGQGVRHLKRALGEPSSAPDGVTPDPSPPPPEPKLLPAKGETSPSNDGAT